MTKESCIKFVAGSHKWGKWFIPIKFGSLANYEENILEGDDKAFENVPDIHDESEKYKILSWDLEVRR